MSLTRIIAEAGLPMVFPRNIPLDVVISGVGAKYVGSAGIAALGPTVIWTESLQSTMMAHAATGLKLSGEIARRKRWLLLAIATAIGVSAVSTFWMTMVATTPLLSFSGDAVSHTVTWSGGFDLSRFAGKLMKLRFHLRNAALYSFQLRPRAVSSFASLHSLQTAECHTAPGPHPASALDDTS